jgi:hypothetical protein
VEQSTALFAVRMGAKATLTALPCQAAEVNRLTGHPADQIERFEEHKLLRLTESVLFTLLKAGLLGLSFI